MNGESDLLRTRSMAVSAVASSLPPPEEWGHSPTSSLPPEEWGHPPTTVKETRGWYAFAFASEPISAVIISGFMPLLVQECALGAAGFPYVCANVVQDATLLTAVFGRNGTDLSMGVPAQGFIYNGESNQAFWPSVSCTTFSDGNTYCPGWPTAASNCLTTSGNLNNLYKLQVTANGITWDPSAFVAAMVALATALQMVVFVSVGSFADYGAYRKRLLIGLSLFCILAAVLALAVDVSTWWAAGVLFVLITIAYGTTFVQYNAWLPLLAANDPETLAAERSEGPVRARALMLERMDIISANGYGAGYVGAVAALGLCVIVTLLAPTAILAYKVNVAVAGIWFAVFGVFPFYWLKPRPGPPLPKNENYLTLPWRNLWTTIKRAWTMPETFKFLGCWWLFSDGMNVIGNVGSQYANAYVDWRPLPKSLGLATLLLITPIFAAIGSVFWPWAVKRWGFKAHQIIALNCLLMSLVPAYGLLGFVSPYLGFRRYYDMILGVIVYGFQIGSMQSYARGLYGSMIPEGLESQFYGLYSFTDKGSSWIGPAVVAGVIQSTGNFRLAFVFPLCVLLPPCIALFLIDYDKGGRDSVAYARLHKTAGGIASRGALSYIVSSPSPPGDEAWSASASPSAPKALD